MKMAQKWLNLTLTNTPQRTWERLKRVVPTTEMPRLYARTNVKDAKRAGSWGNLPGNLPHKKFP